MTDTLVMNLDNENYWVRETAYIVNEMLHAIRQSKNPELTEKQREGYARRSIYLRDRAIFCINNAHEEETNNDSNKQENEQNE
tara:strand:- start:69 stop:317 length:249 start_codon:yes stop_codon:yes gene_type:complete